MKRLSLLLITAGVLLYGCNFFTQPGDLQTENLQNEVAQTQISAVRTTATVNADRLLVTLSGAQTAVGDVDLQSTRMVSTLVAQGTLVVDASGITPIAPTEALALGSPTSQIANPLLTPGAAQASGQGSAQGDSALVPTTPTPIAALPNTASQPSLTNVTLAEQVGSDDCPVKAETSFSSSATDIYVTAVAHDIQPSTSLTATFSRGGQPVKSYPWTPGFAINGKCIWFHLPSSDVAFTPGDWTVDLAIDGTPIGASIPFTIVGNTPAQVNTTPQVGG